MRTQLGAVVAAAETHGRRTNESAALATAIVHDDIPEAWRVYPVAPDLGLAAWIADLGTRLAQCGAPPERVALQVVDLAAVRLGHPRVTDLRCHIYVRSRDGAALPVDQSR